MKIMHTYCLNYNIGDYALGIGVKNIFRDVFNVSFFAESNIQGQKFDNYFIDIINHKYDLLIIGGGGIIHGAHWPNGWFWLIDEKDIEKIKIPFVIYGVGYNYFKDEAGIPERGVSHLKETFRKASFFSVRNDGSQKRLFDQTGIDATVVADPGFWLPLNRKFKNFNKIKNYIVVQLADDKSLHRFGNKDNKLRFIENLNSILNKISKYYKVVFAPHVYDDIELCKTVSKGIKNSMIMDFGKYAFDMSDDFLGIYQRAEFVLGMRGHGQIVPLGFNVPVISLENHHKHKGLMDDFGLGTYNVDVVDYDFKQKLEILLDDVIENNDKIREHITKRNKYLLEDSRNKIKKIDRLNQFIK